MLEKLKQLDNKYAEIQQRMESGEIFADPSAYTKCAKELKELEPIVLCYREYCACQKTMHDAQELMSDPEFRELAQEEFSEAKAKLEELEEKLKILLLPKDPNDSRNVIMEIRGGVGGEESSLFAYDLFRMYSMYAERKGWKIDVVNLNETELGGLKEISFVIEGEGAYSRLKFEAGGHRVQRVPETESGGRIHTSAATVAVLPEAEEVEFEINPSDLQIDTYRSSGAGGQHVNKTESAIRITHLPTGVVVECQDEKILEKNGQLLVVLQSTPENLKEQWGEDLPFSVICDPEKILYRLFEIQTANSKEAMTDSQTAAKLQAATEMGLQHRIFEGEELQLPAAFIIRPDQTVTYAHYGRAAGDVPGIDALAKLLAEQ